LTRLTQLASTLERRLPQTSTIRKDAELSAQWRDAIEEIESKLFILDALSGRRLMTNNARTASAMADTEIELQDLQDLIPLLSMIIVDCCISDEELMKSNWRMRDVILKLVEFKRTLSGFPVERFTFLHIMRHQQEGGYHDVPPLVSVSQSSREFLNVFRIHLRYSLPMGVKLFNDKLNKGMKPDYKMLLKDDDVLMGLIVYLINTGNKSKAVRFAEALKRREGHEQVGTALKVALASS